MRRKPVSVKSPFRVPKEFFPALILFVRRSEKRDRVGAVPENGNPEFTRTLICTLAEATPVHEAADLQKDLNRAGIATYGWIINQSLAPLSVTDPVLKARKAQEKRYISEVVDELSPRTAIVPWSEDSTWGMGEAAA